MRFRASVFLIRCYTQYPRVPDTSELRSELRSSHYVVFLDSLTDEEYYALEAEGNLGDEDEEACDGTRMNMDGHAVDVVGGETNAKGEDEDEGELRADEANDAEEE